jgi:DNA gyrase/topoisomerase IV subunit A-like protein
VLISQGGQVIRTETNTINRYSSQARGVIVMRLAEGDSVAAIAAFSPGLADRDGIGDDDGPVTGGPGQAGPSGGAV